MYDKNNVFYKILKSEIPSKIIYENNIALAFYDINPVCKVHALVITKGLYRNFTEFASMVSATEMKEFAETIVKVIEILDVTETGYRLVTNTGENSGQEVEHFHVHILAGEKLQKK